MMKINMGNKKLLIKGTQKFNHGLRLIKLNFLDVFINPFLVRNKTKIFCIGCNKTGTTSLKKAFIDLGFIVGWQRKGAQLQDEYIAGNFEPIIKYCRSAQVFQDIPFSLPETYKHLDRAYPGSKFILSIRDSADQWYQSMISFQSKKFGKGKKPSVEDLKNSKHSARSTGSSWKLKKFLYDLNETDDPYDKEKYIRHYNSYNQEVVEYFNGRDCLLVINLNEPAAYEKFCKFIEVDPIAESFPWENKTTEVKIRV